MAKNLLPEGEIKDQQDQRSVNQIIHQGDVVAHGSVPFPAEDFRCVGNAINQPEKGNQKIRFIGCQPFEPENGHRHKTQPDRNDRNQEVQNR